MDVFENKLVLKKKLQIELLDKKLEIDVLEKKLEMDLLEKKTCNFQLQLILQELHTKMAWPQ
jgi:hypothetical protein